MSTNHTIGKIDHKGNKKLIVNMSFLFNMQKTFGEDWIYSFLMTDGWVEDKDNEAVMKALNKYRKENNIK